MCGSFQRWWLAAMLAASSAVHADPCCIEIDLRAGPLWDGLQSLARLSGESIRMAPDAAALQGLRHGDVRGQLALPDALDAMLAGTTLAWSRDASGLIVIDAASTATATLDPLRIDAASMLAPVVDTGSPADPQLRRAGVAVDSIDAPWLGQSPLGGMAQVLRRAPNITGFGESLAIRGIERGATASATSSVYLDGIPLGSEFIDAMLPVPPLAQVAYLRGAMSGRDAFGGLAGAIRLDSMPPGPANDAQVVLETSNRGTGAAVLLAGSGASGELSGRLFAASGRQRGDHDNGITGARGIDATRQQLLHAGALWEPDERPELTIRISALLADGDPGNQALVPPRDADAFDPFARASADPFQRTQHLRAHGGSILATWLGERHRFDAHLAYSDSTLERDTRLSALVDERSLAQREERFATAGITWDTTFAERWRLAAGLEFAERDDLAGERNITPLEAFFPEGLDAIVTPATRRIIAASDIASARRAALTLDLSRRFGEVELGLRVRRAHERRTQRRAVSVQLDRSDCTLTIAGAIRSCDEEFPRVESGETLPSRDLVWVPEGRLRWNRAPGSVFELQWRRGFLAGGARRDTRSGTLTTYLPERSDTVEAVWEAGWSDDRLTSRIALFHNRWKDRQVAVDLAPQDAFLIVNAGRSHAFGGEAELRWRATERHSAWLGAGWLRTRFDRFSVVSVEGDTDLAGNEFAEAPRVTVTLGLRSILAPGWAFDARGWHSAATFSDSRNTPAGRRPAYTLLDLRLTRQLDASVEVWLFVDNALDADYLDDVRITGVRNLPSEYRVGRGRIAGAGLRWSW